jgi:hypothetical protein
MNTETGCSAIFLLLLRCLTINLCVPSIKWCIKFSAALPCDSGELKKNPYVSTNLQNLTYTTGWRLGGSMLEAASPDAGAAGDRIKLWGIRGRDA